MTFLAPGRLWLALLPAALAVAYVIAQRARRRHAVRFSNLELLAALAPKRPGWRRHVTAAGLLAALALLTVGFARPATSVRVPREQATLVLALDISRSMAAIDVSPSRLAAAQQAARDFAADLPQPLKLGLVVFAGTAQLRVPPTNDRGLVIAAIDSLDLQERTAIGEAIFTSLDAIAADAAATGSVTPVHVVVMSDGTTTAGRPNDDAVAAAVEAEIPVSTIAYGTDAGVVEVEGQLIPVPVDRDSLRSIAEATKARFFEAADADQLKAVYEDIGRSVGFDVEHREVTAWFTGLALGVVSLAAVGSLVWLGRLP